MGKKEKIVLTGVILVGMWSFVVFQYLRGEDIPSDGFKYPTSSVQFQSNSVKVTSRELPVLSNSMSLRPHGALSVPSVGVCHTEAFRSTSPSVQKSGLGTLYSTASVSPHSYGGGGSVDVAGYMGSRSNNSTSHSAIIMSSANELHTFVAMSAKVRSSSEEFETGVNAIGADSPNAVMKRLPGGGPITEDPEHQPTVVGTTPVGDGMWFLLMLAMGYFVRCLATKKEKK